LSDERQRLQYAMTLFRKKALVWIRAKASSILSWNDLCTQIKDVFSPISEQQAARDRLDALKQTNSVNTFASEFRRLTLLLPKLPEQELIDKFVRKLKIPIAKEVYLRDPQTIDEAMRIAERVDMISWRLRDHSSNQLPPMNPRIAFANDQSVPMDISAIQTKRLTDKERAYLLANQGCLYCRKTQAGHFARNCPDKLRKN